MDNGASSYRRFLYGDDSGIVEIVRDYKDGLILYLNSYVSNIHTAEELAEDTFFKLLVKKPRYVKKYSFKTWLYTIGRNVAIDYIRHSRRFSDVTVDELERILQDEELLEKTYIKEESRIAVHRALAKLKGEYRQVLYLTFFEDFSNEQAAKVMKKSKRQVEMLVYRAKKSLKSELEKGGFTNEGL